MTKKKSIQELRTLMKPTDHGKRLDYVGILSDFCKEVVEQLGSNMDHQVFLEDFQEDSFAELLMGAFAWEDSIRGREFWEGVFIQYKKIPNWTNYEGV